MAGPVGRDYRQGQSDHSWWERRRVAEGICIKCNNPLSPKSGRYCEEHRVAQNSRGREYQQRNKDACNYRTKISGHRARIRVMRSLGGLACAWCGEKDYRVLSIDHINGHAAPTAERKKYRSGLTSADIYAIERGELSSEHVRVLCMNCQARNEHQRGNRTIYPEVREAVLEAGGWLPDEDQASTK